MLAVPSTTVPVLPDNAANASALSPRARRIYLDLKTAVTRQ